MIRPDKLALAKTETQYLGFVLGHDVIRPQMGKVVKGAERPVTKKQVRSFLELVGWYRKFFPNSARVIALTNIRAVLLQEEQGQIKPVVYIRRKLLPREVNCSTVEKECLAAKQALNRYVAFTHTTDKKL